MSTSPPPPVNLTPPIRRVAAEASSLISSNDINLNVSIRTKRNPKKSSTHILRERSSSASSSTSESSRTGSSPVARYDEDDDESSNDDPIPNWAQILEEYPALGRLSKIILWQNSIEPLNIDIHSLSRYSLIDS
jgi:hypothetical protein